jgi:GNAT superfamily N-acetyltransferase
MVEIRASYKTARVHQKGDRQRRISGGTTQSKDIGFIHYILHENVIDGAPNAFVTAFYVSPAYRGKGVGTLLLEGAITDSLARGAVGVETSTIHGYARKLYEKNHFKRAFGDIGEVFLELDIDEFKLATNECKKL